jgi:hypothetical protein
MGQTASDHCINIQRSKHQQRETMFPLERRNISGNFGRLDVVRRAGPSSAPIATANRADRRQPAAAAAPHCTPICSLDRQGCYGLQNQLTICTYVDTIPKILQMEGCLQIFISAIL